MDDQAAGADAAAERKGEFQRSEARHPAPRDAIDGELGLAQGINGRETGRHAVTGWPRRRARRSEEHTSELQSLMRISYAVFCLKKKKTNTYKTVTMKQTPYTTTLK